MSAKQETTTVVDANALAIALANAVKGIAPKPELREGDPEYRARQQAEGWFDDFFGVTVLQNAYEADPRGLPEDIRRKASQLRAGKYLKDRVTVSVENGGSVVRISYPIKGDNLMKNLSFFRSFEELVTKIWDEMHATAAA